MKTLWIRILLSVFLFWSCGSSDTCVENEQVVCACLDGSTAIQVCTSAGIFTPCPCPDVDAGSSKDNVTSDTPSTGDPGNAGDKGENSDPGSSADLPPSDPGNTPDGGGPDLIDCAVDSDCPTNLPLCLPFGFCALCHPGKYSCDGNNSMVCSTYGDSYELNEDCSASGSECYEPLGVCVSACTGGKLAATNAGCDFYAVDLRNATEATQCMYLDAQDAQFAVIVSNTSEQTANVRVRLPDGSENLAVVPPSELAIFPLPATWGMTGSGRSNKTFRIQSDAQIVAYQFNPLANEDVFSNDASILLPASGAGTEYRVMTLPHNPVFDAYPAYFSIVGVGGSDVEVTMNVTGSTSGGDDIPGLSAGQSHTFTISEGEVVNIESTSGDLTGTLITSSAPVIVFAGHTGARTGASAPEGCCNDHLEQQMPPVSTWGNEFVIARSFPRGNEKDHFRVLAAEAGTSVTISGGAQPPGFSLSAGQFGDFTSDGPIKVSANKPILVAQFLASRGEVGDQFKPCSSDAGCGMAYTCDSFSCQPKECNNDLECGPGHTCAQSPGFPCAFECKPIGDPAMILAVPEAQWQKDFVFLTPNSYVHDYINIVSPPGNSISMDGNPIPMSEFIAVPGSDHLAYQMEVSDGVHTVTADEAISIVVYGYDAAVSYGYPAAMGLK